MSNSAENVSTGKPKIAGAVFRAPKGTTAPADATTSLAAAFKCLGYVSEDGVVNSNARSTENIKAWGGVVVDTPVSEKSDTFKLKLIEALNMDVLAAVHGSNNVTGALATGITVEVNDAESEEGVWVIDMILKGNVAKRIVIPHGNITALDDVEYKDNVAIGYGITLSCMPDSSGNTHYEYIKAASTT